MADVTKDYLDGRLDELIGIIKGSFQGVEERLDERFDTMDQRLDRIENLLIRDLTNRIERLEDQYRRLATVAGD